MRDDYEIETDEDLNEAPKAPEMYLFLYEAIRCRSFGCRYYNASIMNLT
jgi:hypothetical protein